MYPAAFTSYFFKNCCVANHTNTFSKIHYMKFLSFIVAAFMHRNCYGLCVRFVVLVVKNQQKPIMVAFHPLKGIIFVISSTLGDNNKSYSTIAICNVGGRRNNNKAL